MDYHVYGKYTNIYVNQHIIERDYSARKMAVNTKAYHYVGAKVCILKSQKSPQHYAYQMFVLCRKIRRDMGSNLPTIFTLIDDS